MIALIALWMAYPYPLVCASSEESGLFVMHSSIRAAKNYLAVSLLPAMPCKDISHSNACSGTVKFLLF